MFIITHFIKKVPFDKKKLDKCFENVFKLNSLGIYHGDLHTDNILQTDKDCAIIDFGMAYFESERGVPKEKRENIIYGTKGKYIFEFAPSAATSDTDETTSATSSATSTTSTSSASSRSD